MEKKDCLCDLKDHIEEILETSQSDSTIADFIASVTSFLMCRFDTHRTVKMSSLERCFSQFLQTF